MRRTSRVVHVCVDMNSTLIWEAIPFGFPDLKSRAAERYAQRSFEPLMRHDEICCCIAGCNIWLPRRRRGQLHQFCPQHHISMSSAPTYVLANATDNLIVGREYYRRLEHKVDGRRLTHETSEDAVSWNVFVGLFALGGLAQAYESITGQQSEREPELYLWGNRIDTAAPRSGLH